MALGCHAALADPSAQLTIDAFPAVSSRSYIQGLLQGMGWIQAGEPVEKLQFCLPPKLGIEPGQAIGMVKHLRLGSWS
jgi:hypothetical protein